MQIIVDTPDHANDYWENGTRKLFLPRIEPWKIRIVASFYIIICYRCLLRTRLQPMDSKPLGSRIFYSLFPSFPGYVDLGKD